MGTSETGDQMPHAVSAVHPDLFPAAVLVRCIPSAPELDMPIAAILTPVFGDPAQWIGKCEVSFSLTSLANHSLCSHFFIHQHIPTFYIIFCFR